MAANEESFSTLENEILVHIESLVACKTKYKDEIESERSLRVDKLATKMVEHQDAFARKEEFIKIQRDEFTTEKNIFVKSAQDATNKEQENTYTEKSKWRDAQQSHSDQSERTNIKFRYIWKHYGDMLNVMYNMMYGF